MRQEIHYTSLLEGCHILCHYKRYAKRLRLGLGHGLMGTQTKGEAMQDGFRENLSRNARLVDDYDALLSWAIRKGLVDEDGSPVDDAAFDEFADILDHLHEDIREGI